MIIEVCATNLRSIENAALAGADRIELCSELAVGGITPSFGMMQAAVKKNRLPIHSLIRPRSGHFYFSNSEIDIIKRDIIAAKDAGCRGVVIGALTADFKLPHQLLEGLISLALPMEVTFHRAFDVVLNPEESLEELIDLGFSRVLTSGQQEDAVSGLPLLQKLLGVSKGKITIMPGGGIRPENCELFKNAGFEALHFSAFKQIRPIDVPLGINGEFSFLKQPLGESNPDTIHSIVAKVKS